MSDEIIPIPLRAAARILTTTKVDQPKYKAWQEEAWQFYSDESGPLRFGVTWKANALSRVRLMAALPAEEGGDEPEVLIDGAAAELVHGLAGGIGGQSQMLRSFGIHLNVPGEAYLIGRTEDDDTNWKVFSADETRINRGAIEIQYAPKKWQPLPKESLVIKVWLQDEHYHYASDSPTRAALPVLRELAHIDAHIRATLISRLTGPGLLIMPSEFSFPVSPESMESDDPYTVELMEIMMTAKKDPGTAAAMVPILTRGPGEHADKIKLLKFWSDLDSKIIELRTDAVKGLATALDMPAEVLLGMGGMNHWGCVDDQTEILTENGWRTQDALTLGDVVLTLNHETGLSEWQPISHVNRYDVADAPMLAMETASHSSLTTLNHRWPVVRPRWTDRIKRFEREWCESAELHSDCRITTAAPCADQPIEAKWTDDLVELVAWTWTEGHVSTGKGRPGVMLAQSPVVNPENEARIRRCLIRLYGSAVSTLRGVKRPAWREQRRSGSVDKNGTQHQDVTLFYLNADAAEPVVAITPDKHVSFEFVRSLTPAQLELFLVVSMMGDGRHRSYQDITQRRSSQLDAFDLAAILAGRMPVRNTFYAGEAEHHSTTLYQRSHVQPIKAAFNSSSPASVHLEAYTGVVWCPTVPNSSWLARRNGRPFYTGNSWQIEETAIKLHIVPLLEVIAHALTVSYLRPSLESMSESTEPLVWFDYSELVLRPDRSANTIELYKLLEANGAAVRREAGLSEDDKPDETEIVAMAGRALLHQPMTAEAGLELLGIEHSQLILPKRGTSQPLPEPPQVPVDGPPAPPAAPPTAPESAPVQNATLMLADRFVREALRVAGNRIRSQLKGKLADDEDCPPPQMHSCIKGVEARGLDVERLLAGAWDELAEIAPKIEEDPDRLRDALDVYCAGLLVTGRPHTWEDLAAFLAAQPKELA